MTTRSVGTLLANSALLRRGRCLYEENERNWELPLGKIDKLWAGAYVILRDYGVGRFPPTFLNQAAAYQAEIDYSTCLPGLSQAEVTDIESRKPFNFSGADYLPRFHLVMRTFARLGIRPPARLLELGCGSGWMAEFLATMRFDVTGSTIARNDIEIANRRVEGLRSREIPVLLSFIESPMERVAAKVSDLPPYDAVYVFEALHHAFSWREAMASAYECLKPGGWLLIFDEPNILHTFISYRVARLSNTHEIGFRRSELLKVARSTGFRRSLVLRNRFGFLTRPHWIAIQK
jgi:2-polyprenyl-3-methyl-5-hydroxy-6-metoxy-1,4-benzoquinol methylase